jgi:hypothetical protein
MTRKLQNKNIRKKGTCTKWLRITHEEAELYPDINGRESIYKTCGTCKKGTSILHAVHVSEGMGEALCSRCGKDIDLIWLCRERKRVSHSDRDNDF